MRTSRWFIGLVTLLLVGAVVWMLWPRRFEPAEHIPRRSLVMIYASLEDGSLPQTLSTQWGQLFRNIGGPVLALMDSMPALMRKLDAPEMKGAMAILPGEAYQLGWIAAFPAPDRELQAEIFFGELDFKPDGSPTSYQGVELFTYRREDNTPVYFAQTKEAWLIASRSTHLESAVNASHNAESSLAHEMERNPSLADGHKGMYLNFPALENLMSTFTRAEFHTGITSLTPLFPPMRMESHYNEQRLSLVGSRPAEGLGDQQMRKKLPGAIPDSLVLLDSLPARTALAWILPARYPSSSQATANQDTTALRLSLFKDDLSGLNGFWLGRAYKPNPREQRVAFFPALDWGHADSIKRKLAQNASRKLTVEGESVWLLRKPMALSPVFDSMASGTWRFAKVFQSRLLLSTRPEPLVRFVRDQRQGRILAQEPDFVRHKEAFFSSSHWSLYIKPKYLSPYLPYFFDESFLSVFEGQFKPFLQRLDLLLFQGVVENQQLTAQLSVCSGAPVRPEPPLSVRWEYDLGASLQHPPVRVYNHQSKRQEWLCFDVEERISMITPEGNHRWLRQLEAPALGAIFEVDLYQNDKIQYLFNTPLRLYLLDRKGREVAAYPIDLPAKAAAALGAFPLGKKEAMQIFVGCQNGRVYGFNASGKPLSDWNGKEVQGNLSVPFKYFGLGGKRYLFAASTGGYFYLWQSSGALLREIHLKTQVRHPFSMRFAGSVDECRLYSVDTAARLVSVQLDGSVIRTPLQSPPKPRQLQAVDITGDSRYEFLVADERRFGVYERDGKLRRGRFFREPAVPKSVQLVKLDDGRWMLAYAAANANRIYFEDYRSGELMMNGPVNGNAPFYLGPGNEDALLLMTTTEDGRLLRYDFRQQAS